MDNIDNLINNIDWNSPKNLVVTDNNQNIPIIPTIVQDVRKNVIGLAYSSKHSLTLACQKKIGIYHSRDHGLWIKSPSMKNGQKLISIELDCDKDALLFTVDRKRWILSY